MKVGVHVSLLVCQSRGHPPLSLPVSAGSVTPVFSLTQACSSQEPLPCIIGSLLVSQEVILDRILDISYFEKLSVSSEAYLGGGGWGLEVQGK